MALTVVKYRKSATGETTAVTPTILVKNRILTNAAQIIKKPVIKLQNSNSALVINKIPATIKPAGVTVKRSNSGVITEQPYKSTRYSLQAIANAGYQFQQKLGGGATVTSTSNVKKQIGAAISSLPPNTIIQTTTGSNNAKSNAVQIVNSSSNVIAAAAGKEKSVNVVYNTNTGGTATVVRGPTVYVKTDVTKRTIRSVTLELIEKNSLMHLGVPATRMQLLRDLICPTANISLSDCFLTLKKLRQNEQFALLGEYFELSETEAQHVFARSIVKLSSFLRFLVRWPDSKKFYDRHKDLPFLFRTNLAHVQSLIECVETNMPQSAHFDCSHYKFILAITPNGIISYISEAFMGQHDDITIFSATNFKNVIPKYLSLAVDPSKAIRKLRKQKSSAHQRETDSTTDSAEESDDDTADCNEGAANSTLGATAKLSKYAAARLCADVASQQSLQIVKNELTSRQVSNFSIPTMRVQEPVCRLQMNYMIDTLREFKLLQPYAIDEQVIYKYINEALLVAAALVNLQR